MNNTNNTNLDNSKVLSSAATMASISGTLAGLGLAVVGILTEKANLKHTETIADDFFLLSSTGFLIALTLAYWVQRGSFKKILLLLIAAEWVFYISLVIMLSASFILVYTEL